MVDTKVIFPKDLIAEKLSVLAKEISDFYSDGEPFVAVPILNGGVFFYVDLIRQISHPSSMGVISTTKYPNGFPGNNEPVVKFLDVDVKDKKVLIFDEICFTGATLNMVRADMYGQGAKDVRTVVLIHQLKENAVHIPDWSVLEYSGTDWLYGYGMDVEGLHREKMDILA